MLKVYSSIVSVGIQASLQVMIKIPNFDSKMDASLETNGHARVCVCYISMKKEAALYNAGWIPLGHTHTRTRGERADYLSIGASQGSTFLFCVPLEHVDYQLNWPWILTEHKHIKKVRSTSYDSIFMFYRFLQNNASSNEKPPNLCISEWVLTCCIVVSRHSFRFCLISSLIWSACWRSESRWSVWVAIFVCDLA